MQAFNRGSAGLKIELPSVVVAGEALQGSIRLSLDSKAEASVLQLVIHGLETSTVHWTTEEWKNEHSETKHHSRIERHTLVKVQQVLASVSAPAKLASGETVHQFTLMLPVALPSSMGASADGGSCLISYLATAVLSHPDAQQALQAEQEFRVTRPTPLLQPRVAFKETSFQVRGGCLGCSVQGSILFGAAVSSSHLRAGDTCEAVVAVRNNSRSKVQGAEVTIEETTTWAADGHMNESRRVVARGALEPDALENAEPLSKEAMQARSSAAKLRRQVTRQLTSSSLKRVTLTRATLEEEATSGLSSSTRSRLALPVDEKAADSYLGVHIRTTHTMVVNVKGGFWGQPLEMPLQIGDSTPPSPPESI